MNAPAKVEICGNVRIITFSNQRIREDVEKALAQQQESRSVGVEEPHLLLDFTHVEYITSEELGILVSLHKTVRTLGGRLTLFNLNAQVFEVFAVTRLQNYLGICREAE